MSGAGYRPYTSTARARGGEEGSVTAAKRRAAKKEAERQRLRLERLEKERKQSTGYATNTAQYVDATFDPTFGIGGSGTYAKPSSEETFDSTPVTYEEIFGQPEPVAEQLAFEEAERVRIEREKQAQLEKTIEEKYGISYEEYLYNRPEAVSARRKQAFIDSLADKAPIFNESYSEYLDPNASNYIPDRVFDTSKPAYTIKNGVSDGDFKYAPQTFAEAKKMADDAYIFSLRESINDITTKWSFEDFEKLSKGGSPPNYKELQILMKQLNEGTLDFNDKNTQLKLSGDWNWLDGKQYERQPRGAKIGDGGEEVSGSWLSKEEPLRKAVEAQANIMKAYLDNAGIPIVKKYEDIEGFKRPDELRGEGFYLNTGTGAHIDWNANVKRINKGGGYNSAEGSEIGSYGHVLIRPDSGTLAGLGRAISIVGTLTGNPVLKTVGTLAQGGDIEDLAKSYIASEISAPVLEDALAEFGVDADLLGIDSETFSDSLMEVQTTMLEGGSGKDALIEELGAPVVERVVDVAKEAVPEITGIDADFDTPEFIEEFGDAIVSGVEFVGDTLEPVVDVIADLGEPVVDFVDEGLEIFGEKVVDPALQTAKDLGQAVIDPVDDVLDVFGEKVVDPALQTAKDLGQETIDVIADLGEPVVDVIDEGLDILGEKVIDPALQAGKEFGQDVIDVGSDVLSEAEDIFIEPIKQGVEALSDVDLPDIDLPDFDLPDIDLPNFDLPDLDIDFSLPSLGLGGMLAGGSVGQQKTQTEELFDKELFKFDTEIKSTQEMLSPIMNLRRYG